MSGLAPDGLRGSDAVDGFRTARSAMPPGTTFGHPVGPDRTGSSCARPGMKHVNVTASGPAHPSHHVGAHNHLQRRIGVEWPPHPTGRSAWKASADAASGPDCWVSPSPIVNKNTLTSDSHAYDHELFTTNPAPQRTLRRPAPDPAWQPQPFPPPSLPSQRPSPAQVSQQAPYRYPFPHRPDGPSLSHPSPIRQFPLAGPRRDYRAHDRPPTPTSPAQSASFALGVDVWPVPASEDRMIDNFSRPRGRAPHTHQHNSPSHSQPLYVTGPTPPGQAPSLPQHHLPSRQRGLSESSGRAEGTPASLVRQSCIDNPSSSPRKPSVQYTQPPSAASSISQFSRLATSPPGHHGNLAGGIWGEVVRPWMDGEEPRSSFRSGTTASTVQGTLFTPAGTERSSVATKSSSFTEASFINSYLRNSMRYSMRNSTASEGPSIDDVMGMYERGFRDESETGSIRQSRRSVEDDDRENNTRELDADAASAHGSEEPSPASKRSNASVAAKMLEAMSDPLPIPSVSTDMNDDVNRDSAAFSRKSMLRNSVPKDVGLGILVKEQLEQRKAQAGKEREKHDSAKLVDSPTTPHGRLGSQSPTATSSPSSSSGKALSLEATTIDTVASLVGTAASDAAATSSPVESAMTPVSLWASSPQSPASPVEQTTGTQDSPEEPGLRDRYGFRKANVNVTREQYDAWDHNYSEYLVRRRKKWMAFQKENSLLTDKPNRFPPRSNKTKRFVRKGIPPDWRGAAWFYYAGGPAIMGKHRGLYDQMVSRSSLNRHGPGVIPGAETELKSVIVDDIEKDLHRTFPDNIRFKPPRQCSGFGPAAPEPEIIASLRRVLHAFAVYNPRIGYCQSLNFLAGLLLLFVETEEQAFWLLNIITRVYLPGTHEMSLEGSKVDLSVLMASLKESLPSVWRHIGGDEFEESKKGRRGNRNVKPTLAIPADPNRLPAITLCMTAWFMSCFIGTLPIETVLRVWDVFFYEGSRTLFRVALAIFKIGEGEIKGVKDPMEMFGVVQSLPRRMLDCNALLEACYRRRNGIGHLSQDLVEERRQERRDGIRRWKTEQEQREMEEAGLTPVPEVNGGTNLEVAVSRTATGPNLQLRSASAAGLRRGDPLGLLHPAAADSQREVRRKNTLFGMRMKLAPSREQLRAAEVM